MPLCTVEHQVHGRCIRYQGHEKQHLWWGYYDLADDCASFGCSECTYWTRENNPLETDFSEAKGPASEMWFCITPNGTRSVTHKKCVDKNWLERATYRGKFNV